MTWSSQGANAILFVKIVAFSLCVIGGGWALVVTLRVAVSFLLRLSNGIVGRTLGTAAELLLLLSLVAVPSWILHQYGNVYIFGGEQSTLAFVGAVTLVSVLLTSVLASAMATGPIREAHVRAYVDATSSTLTIASLLVPALTASIAYATQHHGRLNGGVLLAWEASVIFLLLSVLCALWFRFSSPSLIRDERREASGDVVPARLTAGGMSLERPRSPIAPTTDPESWVGALFGLHILMFLAAIITLGTSAVGIFGAVSEEVRSMNREFEELFKQDQLALKKILDNKLGGIATGPAISAEIVTQAVCLVIAPWKRPAYVEDMKYVLGKWQGLAVDPALRSELESRLSTSELRTVLADHPEDFPKLLYRVSARIK